MRSLFEKIAVETEEDYQAIIKKLQEFGVKVMRPKLPNAEDCFVNGQYIAPPMTPRDYNIMIGDTYYCNYNLNKKNLKNMIDHFLRAIISSGIFRNEK